MVLVVDVGRKRIVPLEGRSLVGFFSKCESLTTICHRNRNRLGGSVWNGKLLARADFFICLDAMVLSGSAVLLPWYCRFKIFKSSWPYRNRVLEVTMKVHSYAAWLFVRWRIRSCVCSIRRTRGIHCLIFRQQSSARLRFEICLLEISQTVLKFKLPLDI